MCASICIKWITQRITMHWWWQSPVALMRRRVLQMASGTVHVQPPPPLLLYTNALAAAPPAGNVNAASGSLDGEALALDGTPKDSASIQNRTRGTSRIQCSKTPRSKSPSTDASSSDSISDTSGTAQHTAQQPGMWCMVVYVDVRWCTVVHGGAVVYGGGW